MDLDVWKKSMDFVVNIYELSKSFPHDERFGLTSQVRRAVVSIPSNISEGAGRNSDKEFIHFLYVALGSLAEVETQLQLAERLNYVRELGQTEEQLTNIRRMLLGLINHLKKKDTSNP